MSAPGRSHGLEELAGLISFRVSAWHDFGYEEPPAPDCATVPPLGERSAQAITAGHEAVRDIGRLIARLREVRAQLVSELRQDEDLRAARTGAVHSRYRDVRFGGMGPHYYIPDAGDLQPAGPDHVKRAREFQKAHPEVTITFGNGFFTAVWLEAAPEPARDGGVLRESRARLGTLMDYLEARFGQ